MLATDPHLLLLPFPAHCLASCQLPLPHIHQTADALATLLFKRRRSLFLKSW
jgi:hypothetical protein